MSKHPTSELSPRDRAVMEYGAEHSCLMFYFSRRHNRPFWGIAKESLRDARAARERIFRLCSSCEHTREGIHYCRLTNKNVYMREDFACTCKHYKERSQKK